MGVFHLPVFHPLSPLILNAGTPEGLWCPQASHPIIGSESPGPQDLRVIAHSHCPCTAFLRVMNALETLFPENNSRNIKQPLPSLLEASLHMLSIRVCAYERIHDLAVVAGWRKQDIPNNKHCLGSHTHPIKHPYVYIIGVYMAFQTHLH